MENKKYITTNKLAEIRNCKPQTIRRERVVGGGPPYIRTGGPRSPVLYDWDDVLAWMEERKYRNTSEETQVA